MQPQRSSTRSSITAEGTRQRTSSTTSVRTTATAAAQSRPRATSGQSGSSSGGNIKVCVRVRPFNRRELSSQESRCVHVRSRTEVVMTDVLEAEKSFNFDRAYDSSIEPDNENFASQDTLFEDLGIEVKRNAMEGYNSCLFAYGQTGSGKTYSVLGCPDAPGLLPRVVSEVFDELSAAGEGKGTWSCSVAYLEIYMEALRDLLAPPGDTTKLEVRNSPQVGVYIQNLKETPVFSKEDVNQLLEFGAKNRMVAATCMNDQSSRSHCIFTLEIRRKIPGQDGGPAQQLRSKLNLVDLAGSERAKRTQAAGGTLKEGAAINQSLSHLANVIFKLAELSEKKSGKANSDFVPFRNSKLTMALMDSLGGNSKTIMVAALSPAEVNYDETLSTLQFAKRVKVVKCSAKQNAESEGGLVARLKAECEQLKAQIAKGGQGGDNDNLEAMEALVDKYGQNLEGQLDLAREMQATRSQALKDLGLSSDKIGESLGLDQSTPQLVNISGDPALAGCLVYFLTKGEPIAVGSTSDCKIKLMGLGMRPTMAVIHNRDNVELTIEANEGRVFVNGKLVRGEQQLKAGDRLILGHAYAFRVMIPLAKEENERQAQQKNDLEAALAEVVPSNSESYQKCKFFVNEMQDRIGQEKAQSFLSEFGKVTSLVDEANAITAETRPGEGLRFCAEVLTDMMSYQHQEPEVVVKLKRIETGRARLRTLMRKSRMTRVAGDDGKMDKRKAFQSFVEEETYETVAVLDVPAFERRLSKLRAIYQSWMAKNNSDDSDDESESEESSSDESDEDDPFGGRRSEAEDARAERRASTAESARVSFVATETVPMRLGRRGTPEDLAGASPAASSTSAASEVSFAVQRGRRASQAVLKAVSQEHESDRTRWAEEMQGQLRRADEERERHREAEESWRRQMEELRRGYEELRDYKGGLVAPKGKVALPKEAKDRRIAELEAELKAVRAQANGTKAWLQEPSATQPQRRNPAAVQQKLKKDGAELVEAARLASKLMRGLQGVRQGLLVGEIPPSAATPRARSARPAAGTS